MREKEEQQQNDEQKFSLKKWLARFGVAGFLFFFIKGMLWLIVPTVLIYFGYNC